MLLGVVWWVLRQGKDTANDYFLTGRNLGWLIVGASVFSSNIGAEHLVGLAGSGATAGVAMAQSIARINWGQNVHRGPRLTWFYSQH